MTLPGFDIRYTYITDSIYLKEWLQAPGILENFAMSPGKEMEEGAQCWMSFCRWHCSLTATVHHTPCAIGTIFLMPYKKVAHQGLFKMVVSPQWQRKGIGSSLLKNLKHLGKNYFNLDIMNIEVFEGNPIIYLLEQQGFHEIFRQEKYVKSNGLYRARIFMEAVL